MVDDNSFRVENAEDVKEQGSPSQMYSEAEVNEESKNPAK